MAGYPGGEEDIIEGLKEELGNDFPLIGSSADNTIEGIGSISSTGISNDNVTLVAIFDDTNVLTTAFSSGYDPSENIGTVTKAGDRVILEIDNQPAAEVYNKWSNVPSMFQWEADKYLDHQIFNQLVKIGQVANLNYCRLSHPETVTEDVPLLLQMLQKVKKLSA